MSVPPIFLAHMAGDQLGHFEHADLIAPVEDGPELVVGIDTLLIFSVLQLVLLDVTPNAFGDLRSRERLCAYNRRQLFVRLNGTAQGRVGLAPWLLRTLFH